MKKFKMFKFIVSLLITVSTWNSWGAGPTCENVFKDDNQLKTPISQDPRVSEWENLYKKSDLKPNPQVWQRIGQSLEKRVTHLMNPLELAGTDGNKIGAVYKSMVNEFPVLGQLIQVEKSQNLTHAQYVQLKRQVAKTIIGVASKPHSELQIFAAQEALKYLATIESRVQFPRTKEDIENEKKEIEKKKKDKEKEDDEQDDGEEEEPKWNKTQDQYNPENKDISSKGKKQKSVDIVMTNAEVHKGLLRQKIYDQFDLKKWSSVPIKRQNLSKENNVTKKMVINPLGEAEIDIPVPYGYSIKTGKFQGFEIKETGPGEYKLLSSGKNKSEFGMTRLMNEPHLSGLKNAASAAELAHWPKHLLTFTQSLKGLSPMEAAARLEKYISEDGGFLYYSKGDKLDKNDLAQIDQKMQSLMATMPKPMAMANVGSFNCDGAAWIGGLLLRDVLGLEVRIAGGRTSAGTRTIEQDKFHVVRSSDPAHAWVEVYDGKHWVPFDMTPKNNTPDSDSAPTDLKREEPKQDQKPSPPKKDQKPQPGEGQKSDSKEKGEKSEDEKKDKDEDGKKTDADKDKGQEKDKDGKDKDGETADETDLPGDARQKIDDLIKSKSTQRSQNESQMQLIDKLLKQNELMTIEHLIAEGTSAKYMESSKAFYTALKNNPSWSSMIERSEQKMMTLLNDATFNKFSGGLVPLINEARIELGQNKTRDAKMKLIQAQKLLTSIAEYRSLTTQEVSSLTTLQKIMSELDQIKHKNSKEFDVVDQLIKSLPGNSSKAWIKKQYGEGFDKAGTDANIKLAQDIVSGKLKPLLQMATVNDFVDMTLNSTPEPQWKEEPTLTRAIVPKPRQDLIVTRNPLDFAKMLWNLRPGEHMFAPTLQGRQFAMGSLETRRVQSPKNPIEKKVSVIYYDISGSMGGHPIETQDALLMAFVDKALSETDAIGRPTHEIYLIPFDDKIFQGVHIASREDAQNYLAQKMNYRTTTAGGTDIQKVIENFYSLISTSFRNKSQQGRDKLFQKANMVLFSDGGSSVDMAKVEEARKSIPSAVEISMNFVSIGDQVNAELKNLSSNEKLSTTKPTFRQLKSDMIDAVVNVSTDYDPEAFVADQRISGSLLYKLNELLDSVNADPRQNGQEAKINEALSQIQITKTDVSQLSGLKEILNLQKVQSLVKDLQLPKAARIRFVQSIIEAYPRLTGRSWKDMTYDEKEAFEDLKKWAAK